MRRAGATSRERLQPSVATSRVRGVLARVRGGLPFGTAGMREGLDAVDVLREGLSHAHHVAKSAGGRQAGRAYQRRYWGSDLPHPEASSYAAAVRHRAYQ